MAKRTACSMEGCDSDQLARGWCRFHYDAARRNNGDPTAATRGVRRDVRQGVTPAERFWSRVDITETCWLWAGTTGPSGYGSFTPGTGLSMRAHRYSFEQLVGPIPEGLEIDHLCRVRACVNPDHMEPVTHAENVRRAKSPTGADNYNGAKTHCPQGHAYDEANTYRSNGRRYCRTCQTLLRQRNAA